MYLTQPYIPLTASILRNFLAFFMSLNTAIGLSSICPSILGSLSQTNTIIFFTSPCSGYHDPSSYFYQIIFLAAFSLMFFPRFIIFHHFTSCFFANINCLMHEPLVRSSKHLLSFSGYWLCFCSSYHSRFLARRNALHSSCFELQLCSWSLKFSASGNFLVSFLITKNNIRWSKSIIKLRIIAHFLDTLYKVFERFNIS